MNSQFWDLRYKDTAYIYGREPNLYFKKFIDSQHPGKILLPGEGEGRNAVYAARKGWEVIAVDQSSEGRRKASLLAKEYNVSITYHDSNLMDFPYPANFFDVVALIFLHLPSEIRPLIHKKFIESLKPEGFLLIEAFSKSQLGRDSGGPKSEDLLYDRYLLNRDFQLLEIFDLRETEEVLNEGPGHQGTAALIRMLGQKL